MHRWIWLALALCGGCTPTNKVLPEPVIDHPALLPDGSTVGPVGHVREIYHGSARSPIAALWLTGKPVVYFADPEGLGVEFEMQKRLARGESVALSRDWSRAVRAQRSAKETVFTFGERPVSLPGRAGIALDSRGRTSVAWTMPDEESGEPGRLRILGADGETLVERPIEGLEWVDVADSGERVALANASETLVLDRNGEPLLRLAHAESGRLSPDGEWLALEQTEHGRHLSLVRLGREPVAFAVRDEVAAFVFDSRSTRLARIAPTTLQTFRLEGDRPKLETERTPPAGFAWRSAAYSAGGRLAAGRIQVVSRPERHPPRRPTDPPAPDTPGMAWLGVDLFSDSAARPTTAVWQVPDWNFRAPELAFGPDGALYALAWPSAFEVNP